MFFLNKKKKNETVSGSKVVLEEGQGLCDVGAIKMCRTIISEHKVLTPNYSPGESCVFVKIII